MEQEPRKPRQSFSWPEAIVMISFMVTALGALALIVWWAK